LQKGVFVDRLAGGFGIRGLDRGGLLFLFLFDDLLRRRFQELVLKRVRPEPVDLPGLLVDHRGDQVHLTRFDQAACRVGLHQDRFNRLPRDRLGDHIGQVGLFHVGIRFLGTRDGGPEERVEIQVAIGRFGILHRKVQVIPEFGGIFLGDLL
jgi:hypothetical protein